MRFVFWKIIVYIYILEGFVGYIFVRKKVFFFELCIFLLVLFIKYYNKILVFWKSLGVFVI